MTRLVKCCSSSQAKVGRDGPHCPASSSTGKRSGARRPWDDEGAGSTVILRRGWTSARLFFSLFHPRPQNLPHNARIALAGNLVRTGGQGWATAPGGCATVARFGNFHPKTRALARQARETRGSLAARARTPAGAGYRAISLIREVRPCRPLPDFSHRGWEHSLTKARPETGRGNGEMRPMGRQGSWRKNAGPPRHPS